MKLFDKFKFFYSMLKNGGDYNLYLQQITNKRFFNNYDKIIGWHKGKPSFFLMAPLLFSKPSAHSISTRFSSLFQWRKLPDMVDIALTDDCNCRCSHCSFISMKKENKIMNLNEYKRIIGEVQDLGVSTINIVGGEPLLNKDFIDIIKSIDKNRSQTVIFTNGYYINDKIKYLKNTSVVSIIVSIDSSDRRVHDKVKGIDGIFDKAVESLKQIRRNKFLSGISHVVYKEDIYNGNLNKIMEFGKMHKVSQIILFDAVPTGRMKDRKDLEWDENDYKKYLEICNYYHAKKDYPGIFPYYYLRSSKSVGCSGGVLYFYISPYGDVCPCDFNPFSIGNAKIDSINDLWDRFSEYKEFSRSRYNGCNMKSHNYLKKFKPK